MRVRLNQGLDLALLVLEVKFALEELVLGLEGFRQGVGLVEEDLPVDLVVDVLDDESVGVVDQPVGAEVPVELLEGAEPLGQVHAGLDYDLRVVLEGVPAEFDLLAALVVQHHFVGSVLPVTSNRNVVFSRFQHAG